MSLCTKRSFYCRVHPHISMRDKFGCLHFDQKVRHGGKLYAVDGIQKILDIVRTAFIKQQLSRSGEGAVLQTMETFAGQVGKDPYCDSRF